MQVVIDRFGRMVLPKAFRDDLGLDAGDVLEATEERESIVLRPVSRADALKQKGNVLVFGGRAEGSLERVVQQSREERLTAILKTGSRS